MKTSFAIFLFATAVLFTGCSTPTPPAFPNGAPTTGNPTKATQTTQTAPERRGSNPHQDIFDAVGLSEVQRQQIAALSPAPGERKRPRRGRMGEADRNAMMLEKQQRELALQQIMTPEQYAQYTQLVQARRAAQRPTKGQRQF